MVNSDFIKRKFSQFVFISFVTYCISYFAPSLIPDSHIGKDKQFHINSKRINGAEYVEGEVLVKFKSNVGRYVVDSVAKSNLSTVAKRYKALTKIDSREYAHFKSKQRSTQQMIQALQKNPQVEAVSPNFILHVNSNIPNDPNFSYLWGLHNTGQMGGPSDIDINAPEAWDINAGSSSVIVGIIDTGIDYNHPDLIPNLWVNSGEVMDGVDNDGNGFVDDIHGINAITATGNPMDDHSHGTHCAGTVGAAGNNNLGVAGVNWNVKLIGTKFLDATGYGTDADAIECINYLIDLKTTYGQNIVAANASFGGGNYDPVMESAINAMGTAGIVFCAAAGNDWMDNDVIPHYPSSYNCSNIIAVTAVDWMGWQNFNYGATSVDLGAPGVDILSTISVVYYPQAGDIFFDDMESGAGNWMTGGINNSWAITTDQEIFEEPFYPVPSPPNFWSDSPGTGYLPDTDSWLMNATDINLSAYVGQNLYLGFGSAMLLEPDAPVDHGYVEVSSNGGSTWQALMDFAQYGYYWYTPWFFLIPDSVKTANFRFRFHLVTDFSIEYDGWLIDDVGIGTADYYGYGYKSGTSMATPHVTGAVALIAAQFPSESVTARINRILNNVTPLPSLIDTCVTEGMLNLYAALTAGVTEYTLTISSTIGGTTNPVSGSYPYPINTPVDVSAVADTGYTFSHWTGDVPSGQEYVNPVTITMSTDKSITANFVPEIIQYTLNISATSGGSTNPSPGIYTHDSGMEVIINALPNNGYKLLNWTGDVPLGHENDNPLTMTMDSDKFITANFAALATASQMWYQNFPGIPGSSENDDLFGYSTVTGDFNGDTYNDLAIGVPMENVGTYDNAGVVHVLYGTTAGLSTTNTQIWHQNSPGIMIGIENNDLFGYSLAAGDFNGDGRDDLAIGAWGEAIGAETSAGLVHILYGSAAGLTATGNQVWHQNSPGIAGGAEAYDYFGWALAAGDFNADTFDDLAVGVPYEDFGGKNGAGIVHILYGTSFGMTETGNQVWCQDSPGVMVGAEPYDYFGYSLAAGDFNGDTFCDLSIGVPYEDIGAINDAGAVNVLYGLASGLNATANQMWHQNSPGIEGGAEAGDNFGFSLAVGDITPNLDDRDELLIGVPWEDIGLVNDAGAINVIIGSAGGLTDVGNTVWYQETPGFPGNSEMGDRFGWHIAIGDFDQNLYNDVAMSVPNEDLAGGINAGVVIVIYGGM